MTLKFKPQAVLSSRDAGYDIQFEEMMGETFVCRNCWYHIKRDHARMPTVGSAIKHLAFHIEDGHRVDPGAMKTLERRKT